MTSEQASELLYLVQSGFEFVIVIGIVLICLGITNLYLRDS